jgi:hypothetical protein
MDRNDTNIQVQDLHARATAAFVAFKNDPYSHEADMMGHCGDRKNPYKYVYEQLRTKSNYIDILERKIRKLS